MNKNAPTLRSRELGTRLRAVLTATGIGQKAIASRLGKSPDHVSRLLNGRLECDEVEVAAFMAACGVGGVDLHTALALCRESNDADLLVFTEARHWARFVKHVWSANKYVEVASAMIPWLLQTEKYTNAVAAQMPRANMSRMDRWSMVHQDCSSMLRSGPLKEFFVPEWALRTPVGRTEFMSEQLHHLLRLSFWSTISLRVLPTAASTPIGLGVGFTLLEFADIRPAVHRETETMSVVAMGEVEVAACRAVVERLRDAACDDRRSRELISRVASELYGPERAQPDDSDQGDAA
jgi:transcriptional regulator with XRE-family HTH domain